MTSGIVKPNIVVICGPTGVGKTAAAIELAELFRGEIISADSMQIYRYMDIGTAKPTPQERARIPHYMIDIVDPDEPFDAARFAGMAHDRIIALDNQGITPFVVGGTGLYIKALLHGLFRDKPTDPEVLERLNKEAASRGADFLYKRLSRCDPETAKRLHPNDIFRIVRALEVYEVTGKPISEYQKKHAFADAPFNTLKICLNKDREILYDRINRRVDAMIKQGLVDEVKGLLAMGYSADLKSMRSIGYRHMVDFLSGKISWDETLRTLKRDTRRYAKRQLTWFRADSDINWGDPDNLRDIRQLIKEFL